jgi:hypothetical protein
MKTNLFILLSCLCIASVVAYSQPISKNHLPEILCSEYGKLKSVLYQDYSKMGVIEGSRTNYEYSDSTVTWIHKRLNSGDWVNYTKGLAYYSNGNRYRYIEYKWSDDDWQQRREWRYEYDQQGRKIDERRYDNSELYARITLSLKENGDTLNFLYRQFKEDSTKTHYFDNTEYFYDEYSKLIKYTTDWGYSDSVYGTTERIYEYDEFNNMIRASHFNSDGVNSLKLEYTYDESNFLIQFSYFSLNYDNMLLEEIRRDIFENDESGNAIKQEIWNSDSYGDFQLVYVYNYSYNDINELIESVTKRVIDGELVNVEKYVYDRENDLFVEHKYDWENKWVENYRRETTFMENGDIEFVRGFYPGAIGLENNSKTTYQYNLDDLISYVQTYLWNGAGWDKSESNYISYDDDQKVNIRIIEMINKNGYLTKDKYEYLYNDNGDTLEIIISENFENHDGKKFHYYFDYDNDNNVITKTYAQWTGYEWYRKSRYISYFNKDNKLDSVLTQFYNAGEWQKGIRKVFNYENEYRYSEIIEYNYNYVVNTWVEDLKTKSYYNENGRIDSLRSFKHTGNQWSDQGTIYYNYTFDEYGNLEEEHLSKYFGSINSTQDYEKYIYEYYEPTDVQENISKQSWLSVSPNPATDNLNIGINGLAGENATIRIYDVYGNCAYDKEMRNLSENFQDNIQIKELSSGLYTVIINSADKTKSRNIIVIK